ncbi:MAG: hypothetical protein QGH42_11735 [Kiritimatiellia bacterium]|jgi:hypothetical protein|nr:hypothetical protein [Kiritimatiellia bacterium]
MERTDKRYLFLIDDGWRYEKLDLLLYLRDKLTIDVATHDELTEQTLKKDMPVVRIPRFPLREGLRYCLTYFFAKELDTHVYRVISSQRVRRYSPLLRFAAALRPFAGKIGLRRYDWIDALQKMYRRSHRYDALLSKYDALIYSPVSIQDKRIVFEAQAMGMETICWVFSWDNPFKDTEFIRTADRYLVWNQENIQDLARWHHIPESRCQIVGPAQFDYLHKVRPPIAPPQKPYILFACTMGPAHYVRQEIKLIHLVREQMDRLCPDVELHVRPYPFGVTETSYEELTECKGIHMLSYGHQFVDGKVLIDERDLDGKFLQMQNALAMITLGSTIALEAALTDTSVLQIIFALTNDKPNLAEIWKHEHLDYVLKFDLPNIVRDEEDLETALSELAAGNKELFAEYSRQLRSFADPLGLDNYREVFYKVLNEG